MEIDNTQVFSNHKSKSEKSKAQTEFLSNRKFNHEINIL